MSILVPWQPIMPFPVIPDLTGGHGVLREAAGKIAHPAIRARGTIGGSICHAEPMADYPAVLVALGAEIEIASNQGMRRVAAEAFFIDFLTTVLGPGEMVTRVHLPTAPTGSVVAYEKFARADGDFATVSVALTMAMDDMRCSSIGLALGSCGPTTIRSREAEAVLFGSDFTPNIIADACQILGSATEPMDDVRGSASYRRTLIPRLVDRAISQARAALLMRS